MALRLLFVIFAARECWQHKHICSSFFRAVQGVGGVRLVGVTRIIFFFIKEIVGRGSMFFSSFQSFHK